MEDKRNSNLFNHIKKVPVIFNAFCIDLCCKFTLKLSLICRHFDFVVFFCDISLISLVKINFPFHAEDFANDVELTEEQQILLLEEYEKEIASKKARDNKNKNTQTNKKDINKLDKINKNVKTPVKKTDECGNNMVEDYFGDKEVKDDASANSDESWEKEFEIEEPVEQKA